MASAAKGTVETKRCVHCGHTKPVGEFYARQSGAQKGQTISVCIECNTDFCRLRDYKARERKGTLTELIEDMKARLRIAQRARREVADEVRNERALEIGLRVLAEQEKQGRAS